MKEVSYIDDEGYFVERRTISKDKLPNDNLVSENLPTGLIKPLWDGVAWVEGVEESELKDLEAIRRETERRRGQKRKQKEAQALVLEKITADYLTSEDLSDEEKELFVNAYDEWVDGKEYIEGDKVVWDGVVYQVTRPHTSQPNWRPDRPTHMFEVFYQSETSKGETVYELWKQPTGAHDAYPKGKVVEHNDLLWISTVENNVWQPSTYGWAKEDEMSK